MDAQIKNLVPKYIVKPGDILSDEIQARGFSIEQLLNTLGLSTKTLEGIIKNKIIITSEIAVILGKAFDQSPEFWLNLQLRYNELVKNQLQVEKAV